MSLPLNNLFLKQPYQNFSVNFLPQPKVNFSITFLKNQNKFFEKHLEKRAKMKFFYHLFENLAMFQNRWTGLRFAFSSVNVKSMYLEDFFQILLSS